MTRFRPGCILRSTLAFFGIVFVPIAVFFLVTRRNVRDGVILLVISAVFLALAFDRREHAWLSSIDDLGGNAGDDK